MMGGSSDRSADWEAQTARWLPCRLAVAPGLAVVCLSWWWCRRFWRVFWRALVSQCLESRDGGKSSARLKTTSVTLQLLPHNTQGRADNSRTTHDTRRFAGKSSCGSAVHRAAIRAISENPAMPGLGNRSSSAQRGNH